MPPSVKVSVVLTSYNHAGFLRESIESVLNQTYRDFELIIWDDASTDDSWQIISSYSDPRIRAIRNDVNARVENVRRAISEVAGGELIAIQHSDDVWEAEKLEKQVAYLDGHPEVGAAFTHASIIDERGQPFQDRAHFYYRIFNQPNRTRHEWLNFFFFHGNALCHPSVLIRRGCYQQCGTYRYGFAQLPDFDMWVRLCLRYDIHVLPEKLVRFRVRAPGLNTSGNSPDLRARLPLEALFVYRNYLEALEPREFLKIFPSARQYLKDDGFDSGYALARLALGTTPSPSAQLFGLTLLFEALNDPPRSRRLQQLYGFGHMDFIALSARHDAFATDLIANLSGRVDELAQVEQELLRSQAEVVQGREELLRTQAEVVHVREELLRLQRELLHGQDELVQVRTNLEAVTTQVRARDWEIWQILHSRSWRLMEPIRRLRGFVLPIGSRRVSAARAIFDVLRGRRRQRMAADPQQALSLRYELATKLPVAAVTGKGNYLFLSGWCFHPRLPTRKLSVKLLGFEHRVPNSSMARPDVLAEFISVDQAAESSLNSGFWAFVPLPSVERATSVNVTLSARLGGGRLAETSLGDITLVPHWDSPPAVIPQAQGRSQPLVVICLATYNPPMHLFQIQVQSLIGQSHSNWICIINDDCSNLETYEQIQRIAAVDKRFVVFRNESRLGFYYNFERALERVPASADYVAFCDQDDEWYPDKLARTLLEFQSATDQLVYCDMDIRNSAGEISAHTYWSRRRNNFESLEVLLFANTVTGAASVFRADLLNEILPFPQRIGDAYHDHWVACVALTKGRMRYVAEPLYAYRQHGGNAYGFQAKVEAHRLLPELSRIPSWFRSRALMRGEVAAAIRNMEAGYHDYLLRLILIAKLLERRVSPIVPSKRASLRSISSAEVSASGLVLQGLKYLISRRPSLGYELYALRSYVGHYLFSLYYRLNRSAVLRHYQESSAPTATAPVGEALSATGDLSTHDLEGSINLVKKMMAPLQIVPQADEPRRVNLLMATINFKYVYGGYIAMFNFARKMALRGHSVRLVIVEPCDYDPAEWRKQILAYPGIEDLFDLVETSYHNDRSQPLLANPEDVFVATSCWTAHIAHQAARSLAHSKFVFFAQEYEPLFFPMGSLAALSNQSYFLPQYTVFSTDLLRDYFVQNRLGVFAQPDGLGSRDSLSFENAINTFPLSVRDLQQRKIRKLLFYARPEPHAARNMFELGLLGIVEAAKSGTFNPEDWRLYGIGTLGKSRRLTLSKNLAIELMPKVDLKEYLRLLPTFDLGLSLMLSPHPSLMPIEMASAGMISVTNTYANKTAQQLSRISSNIVAVPPTVEGIAQGLATGTRRSGNFEDRISGTRLHWATTWDEAFSSEFMAKLDQFIAACRQPA